MGGKMKDLGRLITAMITPFDEEGKVDYIQTKKLALALLDSGSDGLVLTGTTGESPTLTHEEEMNIYTEVKKAVGDSGSIIAGTGSNSTAEAVEATKAAEKIGVDACLLVTPYYNKPSQEGLYQHFKTIAESTSLPCILYNVPSRTVVKIDPETVIKLSQIDNIIGIKDAGNLDDSAAVIAGARKGFLVWSGNDADALPMLSIGGYGIISVASHLVGLQIKDMINKYLNGNAAGAAAIHAELMPLIKALFVVSNPVPVKYAVNQIGFKVGKPRLPLVEPDEKAAAFINETLKKYRIYLSVT
jgi:4-hydroxy-tetrahydrodipicolinate synthase